MSVGSERAAEALGDGAQQEAPGLDLRAPAAELGDRVREAGGMLSVDLATLARAFRFPRMSARRKVAIEHALAEVGIDVAPGLDGGDAGTLFELRVSAGSASAPRAAAERPSEPATAPEPATAATRQRLPGEAVDVARVVGGAAPRGRGRPGSARLAAARAGGGPRRRGRSSPGRGRRSEARRGPPERDPAAGGAGRGAGRRRRDRSRARDGGRAQGGPCRVAGHRAGPPRRAARFRPRGPARVPPAGLGAAVRARPVPGRRRRARARHRGGAGGRRRAGGAHGL